MINYPSIKLESQIITVLNRDNVNGNTIHFIWDRAPFGGNYVLKIITRNVRTNENFLLKQIDADSEYECLRKMWIYIDFEYLDESAWTVVWNKNFTKTTSYFRAKTEDEVRGKFYHDYNGNIESITLNPES